MNSPAETELLEKLRPSEDDLTVAVVVGEVVVAADIFFLLSRLYLLPSECFRV